MKPQGTGRAALVVALSLVCAGYYKGENFKLKLVVVHLAR
jgi:hypothetical protein